MGDQPEAISQLVDGVRRGQRAQVLQGVTGSGKTFTVANVIAQLQRPTLVLSHNKTLAAQLYGEFKQFFPNNAVEYFVSYYDYYQPEAYIPSTNTYIEKDLAINEELDNKYTYVYDRHSVRAKRTKTEIGMHAVRGGTIVGTHEIIFAGRDEVITLKHEAHSRQVFAVGSVNAACFLAGKTAGMYTMNDLIREM